MATKNKNTFIKEIENKKESRNDSDMDTFAWNKNVVPARKPDSMNMQRRSTMQSKAPKYNSNTVQDFAAVKAKRNRGS